MIKLVYKKGIVTFRKQEYELNGYELIDTESVHLFLNDSSICFVIVKTTINGVGYKTVEEFLNALNFKL